MRKSAFLATLCAVLLCIILAGLTKKSLKADSTGYATSGVNAPMPTPCPTSTPVVSANAKYYILYQHEPTQAQPQCTKVYYGTDNISFVPATLTPYPPNINPCILCATPTPIEVIK